MLLNGEYERSFLKYAAANEILEKINGRNTIQCANCYVCMAQIKYKLKKYQIAVDLYEIALDIYITLLGRGHIYTYRIYLNLLYLSFMLKHEFRIQFFEQKLVSLLEDEVTQKDFYIYDLIIA